MPASETAAGRERLREIVRVLRSHQIVKGVTPEKLRMIFEDLGPTFIKFGQILSMRSDMLPLPYCEELRRLRADVRPMEFALARAEVERSLQKPLGEVFSRFDRQPVGSASIAQAHYAQLKNGEPVVVKIRRPGIREIMEQDVALLRRVSGLLKIVGGTGNAIDFGQIIGEMWTTAQQEMDFLREADQAEEFRRLNAGVAYVVSPRVFRSLSSSSVLVMEYLGGLAIDDTAALEEAGYDRNEIGQKLAENYVKQIAGDGFFHADPHPGNLKVLGGKIVWLDMGMMGRLSPYDRSVLRAAMNAVASSDLNSLCGIVGMFCDPDRPPDRPRLYADLDALLSRYQMLDLGSMNLLKLRADLLPVLNRNRIIVPQGIAMLARGLVTVEGVVGTVAPDINVLQIIMNHLSGRALEDLDLDAEIKKALISVFKSGRRVPGIPSQVSELLKMGIKGQTKTNIEITGSEEPLRSLEKMAERIAVGLVEGGLLIASAILCASDRLPQSFLGVPWAGAAGFAAAFVLGAWFFWGMFRRKRPRR